ncbi:MAG: hypothetical protein ACEY3I_00345 [Arsenophonus sp.]
MFVTFSGESKGGISHVRNNNIDNFSPDKSLVLSYFFMEFIPQVFRHYTLYIGNKMILLVVIILILITKPI